MKTAIYIEDGIVQLVITPETKFEKNALSSFEEKPLIVKLKDYREMKKDAETRYQRAIVKAKRERVENLVAIQRVRKLSNAIEQAEKEQPK